MPDTRVRARMPTKREALNDGNGAQMHKKRDKDCCEARKELLRKGG